MHPDPIKTAIGLAGSVKALAESLGIRPQAISQWKQVPVEHARAIEALTGIPKHAFRPDIWDAPGSSAPSDSPTESADAAA